MYHTYTWHIHPVVSNPSPGSGSDLNQRPSCCAVHKATTLQHNTHPHFLLKMTKYFILRHSPLSPPLKPLWAAALCNLLPAGLSTRTQSTERHLVMKPENWTSVPHHKSAAACTDWVRRPRVKFLFELSSVNGLINPQGFKVGNKHYKRAESAHSHRSDKHSLRERRQSS